MKEWWRTWALLVANVLAERWLKQQRDKQEKRLEFPARNDEIPKSANPTPKEQDTDQS